MGPDKELAKEIYGSEVKLEQILDGSVPTPEPFQKVRAVLCRVICSPAMCCAVQCCAMEDRGKVAGGKQSGGGPVRTASPAHAATCPAPPHMAHRAHPAFSPHTAAPCCPVAPYLPPTVLRSTSHLIERFVT